MPFQPNDEPRVEDLVRALITWLQNWWVAPRERSKTADWAMVVVTMLAVTAAIWSALIFQSQLTEARNATKAAQEQLETMDRPWVSITLVPNGPLAFTSDGLNVNLHVHLENIGRGVANNVTIHHVGLLTNDPFHEPMKRQDALCSPDKLTKDSNVGIESSLFPGKTDDSLFIGDNISRAAIASNAIKPANAPAAILTGLFFVGCVDYRYGLTTKHHQTRFVCQVGRAMPNTAPDVVAAIFVGQSVPAQQVRVTRWLFGGDGAT
jgi:hypothetical protein